MRTSVKNGYPYNWATEIRPRIMARAGEDLGRGIPGSCEWCHILNHSFVARAWRKDRELSRVVLTIAHLDHDPANNDPDNLRALCQMCHNTHDRPTRLINAAYTRRETRRQKYFPFEPNREEALRMAAKAKDHAFNVLIDAEQKQKLEQLAELKDCSQSQILRRAMDSYWLMAVAGTPICADGQGCKVPQMFAAAPPVVVPPASQFRHAPGPLGATIQPDQGPHDDIPPHFQPKD